jgi:uncharacterized damage-inducible protein DinB
MQNNVIWAKREFDYESIPAAHFPLIVERLRGTPARVEEKVKSLTPEILTNRYEDKWSIQEIIGHLWVVEALWDKRLDDFLQGREILSAADLSGKPTDKRTFIGMSLESLLKSFRKVRVDFVARLDELNEEQAAIKAQHPRLNKPMRLIDMIYFAAEHDDQHLARMTDLINILS